MRITLLCACAVFLGIGGAVRARADLLSVVRLTDLRDNAKYQVCTEAEKRKLESELCEEEKAFPRAVDAARDEWTKALNTDAFPTTRIKARTLKVLDTAINREKADKLVIQEKLREERMLVKEREDEERALKSRRPRSAAGAEKRQVQEVRKEDQVADRAETFVRKKLSAAVGHEVPFYGVVPEEPKKAGRNKRK